MPRALTQLGLLLGPASLIALFCQFADVSARNTAAASIAVVILVAICHYRSWLNKHVPASLVIALGIIAAGIYYFTYENILIKDTGLIRYYIKSNDYLADTLERELRGARTSIWFFGVNFHISAEDKRDSILAALKSGVHVRYLVFDPASSYLERLASDLDSDPKNLKQECEAGLSDLAYIQQRWNEIRSSETNPGDLEIRLYETTPRMRGYFFDPGPKGIAYLVPYINGVNSPESPGFLFGNFDAGVAKTYFSGVQKLWQRAKPYVAAQENVKQAVSQ